MRHGGVYLFLLAKELPQRYIRILSKQLTRVPWDQGELVAELLTDAAENVDELPGLVLAVLDRRANVAEDSMRSEKENDGKNVESVHYDAIAGYECE